MKLKGEYSAGTVYDVGDVVVYSDGHVYHLQKPCKAGVPPVETLYWGKIDQTVEQCVLLTMDALATAMAAIEAAALTIPTNISEDAISLKTDDGEYLITVDDSGSDPELVVTPANTEPANTEPAST